MKRMRHMVADEKFALCGIPAGAHTLQGLSEQNKADLVGNMYNGFCMSVLWISLLSNCDFEWLWR